MINIGNIWQTIPGNSITVGLTYILEVEVGYRLDVGTASYTADIFYRGVIPSFDE